ncbi:TetR family transcriptional regulator, partial [Rhodospirillum rubrum]|uniref:TetR/AcrR family transcriptional regulator n=2 Tax=Rhodospirillum rubrum TaxID=1085 RepID=UPI001904DA3F
PPRGPGRPREFDLDVALDGAIVAFCERGFHANSITQLSEAMGVGTGSLYKAFPDKRGLFLAAVERYAALRGAELDAVLDTVEGGRERLHAALTFYAATPHDGDDRKGCLLVNAATESATFDTALANRIRDCLSLTESRLAGLIAEGQSDGSIDQTIDGPATARLMLCLIHGLRVAGQVGMPPIGVAALVDAAMRTLR